MSVVLNGTTQYGTAAVVAPNDEGTFSVWCKPTHDQTNVDSGGEALVDTDPARHQFTLLSKVFFDGENLNDALGTWTAAAWHNFVVTYKKSTDTIVCYVDGVATRTSVAAGGWGSTAAGTQMTFGARYTQASVFLFGSLAEVAIYSTALSAGNVALLAAGAVPENVSAASLQYHWKLISDGLATADITPAMTFGGAPSFSAADNPPVSYVVPSGATVIGGKAGLSGVTVLSGGKIVIGGRSEISGVTIQ